MVGVQKRKIQCAISLFLVMLYFSGLTAQAQYGGGTGDPNDPYLIYTAEQMNAIGADANDWDKHFKLMADIDLSDFDGNEGRPAFNIIAPDTDKTKSGFQGTRFTGVFDGNGKEISNFSYTSTDTDKVGVFAYVIGTWEKHAVIKDLGLINPNVDAGTGNYVGSLVGSVGYRSVITNCYAKDGTVSGDGRVGGLVGYNYHGTISNCYVEGGNVSENNSVGGLVGHNGGTITYCYAEGGSVAGVWGVGGLVGYNSDTISNCYATGSVTGNERVGGLAGQNGVYSGVSTITNCYATGSVSGGSTVGGLVGWNNRTINNCYSVGGVTGTTGVGGLVGLGSATRVYTSFWDIQTSGQSTSDGGEGKTTAEMQDPSTFLDAGWDFVGEFENGPTDDWAVPLGGGYPILWWQLSPLPELPAFSGGTGSADHPYLISTADELNSIGHNPRLMKAHFKLINDVDLTGIHFFIIGNELFPFTAVFDGGGHTISNFSYTSTDADGIGVFGYVRGVVKDLGLINPNIDAGTGNRVGSLVGSIGYRSAIINCYAQGGSVSGNYSVGGLVGYNYDGTITNCYATGDVGGNHDVGGLVGENRGTITNCYATSSVSGTGTEWWHGDVGGLVGSNSHTITNCYATGSVTGNERVGGLVGYNYYGTITNCYATGSVTGNEHVGGLVGYNSDGTITNCSATASVSGNSYVGGLVGCSWVGTITNSYSTGSVTGNQYAGGLVGENDGTITNSYARGSVSGTTDVGGLVGQNGYYWIPGEFSGTISNCYSTATVSGENKVGGLVGYNEYGPVTNCFWDIQTSGRSNMCGSQEDDATGCDNANGKTTAEMQTESTFTNASWDFVDESVNGTEDLWWILEGQSYPRLTWELIEE